MTNLLLTVSILVTTNWTEVTTPGNDKEWPQPLEVGRLQTNYVVSAANPTHPPLKAEPAYGPWEFARPVLVPAPFYGATNAIWTQLENQRRIVPDSTRILSPAFR